MKKHISLCATLFCCLFLSGCFTTIVRQEYVPWKNNDVHPCEFIVREVFHHDNVSWETLAQGGLHSVGLEGDWRRTDIKDAVMKRGYIEIFPYQWELYVSHCKKNNLRLSPTDALEYAIKHSLENPKYCRIWYVSASKPSWEDMHRITDKFPKSPKPIPLSLWDGEEHINPLAVAMLPLTVPLDIVTSPIQLIVVIVWVLDPNKAYF
ncbi:MAG: hypothetical protein LBT53_03810 [Puniceicoccales bacterium]|jgi:hypothetical protein|nr:hypothetical protein [Puniceicoccales bacterium]